MSTAPLAGISYNRQTPREILMFTDLIVDTFNLLKATWSNNSQREIGFVRRDKVTKSNIFLGIWYEAWESFGIPLCITLEYVSKSTREKYQQIERFVESKKLQGVIFKRDYQGYALLLFEHTFYNFQNDEYQLAELFDELTKLLEIKLRA